MWGVRAESEEVRVKCLECLSAMTPSFDRSIVENQILPVLLQVQFTRCISWSVYAAFQVYRQLLRCIYTKASQQQGDCLNGIFI